MELLYGTSIVGASGVALFILYLCLSPLFQRHGDALEVTQLYMYPIKGIRGCALEAAHVGPYGLIGDRTFCLQRVHRDKEDNIITRHETLLIGYYLQLALFTASLDYEGSSENVAKGEVVVTWRGRGTEFDTAKDEPHTEGVMRFPLTPSNQGLYELEVDLHGSKTKAYDMGDQLSTWFSDRLGFETRLVHIGDGSRPVLGSLAPNSEGALRKTRLLNRVRAMLPFLAHPVERLAFNDLAHYLVVTEVSVNEVTSRLSNDCAMDVTKFRPNIVVRGAMGPFVEDFWGELTFEGGIQMPLTANCYRCQSITVDYATGKTATDDRGTVWKKLNKDRRVDAGAKYSPVFGRYGYCFGASTGKTLRIGQKGKVTQVNAQRTIFDWPHLTTFGVSKTKK